MDHRYIAETAHLNDALKTAGCNFRVTKQTFLQEIFTL